jgi:hypothetical protein
MTERSDEIRALMQKARQALDDAELLLNHDRVEAAVNRIYYAAFDAAKAALLMKGETPSSHSGVKTRFSYHFVRTEALSREVGRTLAEAEAMRNKADYDAFATFEIPAATDMLTDTRRFVEAIDDLL